VADAHLVMMGAVEFGWNCPICDTLRTHHADDRTVYLIIGE
jgi:hypothetical protein